MVKNNIAITAGSCAETGMKIIIHCFIQHLRRYLEVMTINPHSQAASLRTAVVTKCTTCPVACTPASVRPAQKTPMGSLATFDQRPPGKPAHWQPLTAVANQNSGCRYIQCPAQFLYWPFRPLRLVAEPTPSSGHQYSCSCNRRSAVSIAINAPPKRMLSTLTRDTRTSGMP